jgi:hypothetical protein
VKNVSWQQLVAMVFLLLGPVLAHNFAGPLEGSIVSACSVIMAWLMQSPNGPPPPSNNDPMKMGLTTFGGVFLALLLAGCAVVSLTPTDRTELIDYQKRLDMCQAEGRDAGSYAVYERCTKEAGL